MKIQTENSVCLSHWQVPTALTNEAPRIPQVSRLLLVFSFASSMNSSVNLTDWIACIRMLFQIFRYYQPPRNSNIPFFFTEMDGKWKGTYYLHVMQIAWCWRLSHWSPGLLIHIFRIGAKRNTAKARKIFYPRYDWRWEVMLHSAGANITACSLAVDNLLSI